MQEILINVALVSVILMAWLLARIKDEVVNRLSTIEYQLDELNRNVKEVQVYVQGIEEQTAAIERSINAIHGVAEDYRRPQLSDLDIDEELDRYRYK
jgi:uncharacterized protein YoxC